MRTPQVKQTSASASGQKKQLVMLAGLAVVLVAVVALQFGEGSAPVAQALTADDGSSETVAASKPASTSGQAAQPLELSRNLALGASNDGTSTLNSSAFDSFFSLSEPVETGVEELPPPTILLSATLIGREGELDVAVIDGSLHYVGDMLQGWRIDSISSRAVSLRSSSNRVVNVAMPLFRPTPPPETPVAGP